MGKFWALFGRLSVANIEIMRVTKAIFRPMKDKRSAIGTEGEQLAANYLIAQGFKLLAQNWRAGRAEVDLIFRSEKLLVFVEVKTRAASYFGSPGSFLTKVQEARIGMAATAYCEEAGHEWEIRFDLIEVLLPPKGKPTLKHYPDAFYPGDTGW